VSLRILIDLQGAQNGSRFRGIGRYSLAVAKAIAQCAGDHRIYILLNALFSNNIPEICAAFSGILDEDRFLIFDAPGPVSELRPENNWRRRTAEILREHVIASLAPDAVLVSSMVEGAEDNAITSLGSLPTGIPSAVILYDLIPLSDPERHLGWEPIRRWYLSKIDSLRRANRLFAISESSADEAIRMLPTVAEKIDVVMAAADGAFTSGNLSADDTSVIAARYGIKRKYVMHSSAFEFRKNFPGLIRAYAALPAAVRRHHQLVLVSNPKPQELEELRSIAVELGLATNELIVTGFVPDEDLIPLYVGCHLFVFPSFHEGFGLPALEAMCCGIPTIGSNRTSIPEVIGRNDAVFDPTSIHEITALMLRALTDAAFYLSLKAHSRLQASKFSWAETARRILRGIETMTAQFRLENVSMPTESALRRNLIEAIAEVAREQTPTDLEILAVTKSIEANEIAVNRVKASSAFSGPIVWRLEGPFDSTYSLAVINREAARAMSDLGHNVVLHSTEGPGDLAANPAFLALNPDLAAMHARTADYPPEAVDLLSRNLYPPRVADMRANLNLMHNYAWEESGLPASWVDAFNQHLDGLACVSSHVEKTLIDNGVHVPTVVTGNGIDHWERVVAAPGYKIEGRDFRFLHVSSCFPRKGIDALLDAYGRAFSDSDNVSLVIKTFENPHNEIESILGAFRARIPGFPNVVVIFDDLSDSDLKALYQNCHALVAPSRAEGFGLPLAEAMLSGLPVITTAWSGQLDFCTEETAWLIDYTFKRAQSHFELFDSVWAEPNVQSLATAMMSLFEMPPDKRLARSLAGRRFLLENFKWSDVDARLLLFANSLSRMAEDDDDLNIGWVTTWNTKCGVASYSEHLLRKFPQSVTILAPHEIGTIREDGPECVRVWRTSKDENCFEELAEQISKRNLDIVILQFNYGFFNFRQLHIFITQLLEDGRRVLIMMHSTGDPGLLPEWNWTLDTLIPTLAQCQRVLVHSIADMNRLKDLGLVDNVCLFPHGVLDVPVNPAAATERSTPVICSYGFCLPHKGLIELVQAVALLRDRGTRVRLRLVNAEYPIAVSAQIVSQIRELVSTLGLDDLVELHHEYLADEESLRLLEDASLIVYPYQHTQESASGAVRFGLAARRPVAVTPINVFGDLGDAVHHLPGITPQEIAGGIAAFLDAASSGTDIRVRLEAERWRSLHTHASLSTRLHGICKAIARSVKPRNWEFDGSSKRLKSDVGQIMGRSRVSNGSEGYLIYGPNLSLAAGHYRIILTGFFRIPLASKARFDVCVSGGTEVLVRKDLVGSADAEVVNVSLLLKRARKDLEVRVLVEAGAEFGIDRLEIKAVCAPNDTRYFAPQSAQAGHTTIDG
jgi:O-antigen biosynthesis alpha-1,2-mannosyltransferase